MHGGITNPGFVAFVEALLEGRLKLGQTLRLEELCDILGMSLSPLREAITLLEAEGLIQVRKRLGVSIFYPDVKFVGGTFQFRELLESEGLRRLSEGLPSAWIDDMLHAHAAIIELARCSRQPADFVTPVRELEERFHGGFVAAFDNEQITANYQRLTQKMYLLRLLNPDAVNVVNTIRSMEEHLDIVVALRDRDVERAIEALHRHLKNVLHRLLTR
ncbi:GntR family transcriptional regulator [Agrobacterium leguminum]|uniref:GntR family transcriptional regulator n=1 Tax=Agrobacterium leguminum TaxID=2792015 RepID=UPI003CE5B39D